MENFNLKKFLVENKLTTNSRLLKEGAKDKGTRVFIISMDRGDFDITRTYIEVGKDAEDALYEIEKEYELEYPDYDYDDFFSYDYPSSDMVIASFPGQEGAFVAVEETSKFAKDPDTWTNEEYDEFASFFEYEDEYEDDDEDDDE